ncbi:hypothetical protein WA026_015834 [Henosepilachna vigintioctopunctata]|uniref:Uncharacterized protein n=1 Tax=Henosepilachna vigintioctopunctata TaxID=420089 RepID=A0AAW1V214_9CUCU
MEKAEVYEDLLKYSQHARNRQVQRDITDAAIDKVLQHGMAIDCKETKIIIDQNLKIVLSKKDNTVITVNKNIRNTRFQLSERTKQREQSLLYKVENYKDSNAMCELADLYLTAELGERNIDKVFMLYESAANKGNSHAMSLLSQLYESDTHGRPNQKKAEKWRKMAADRNNTFALAITGQKLLQKYLEKYPIDSKLFRPSAPKKEILHYLNKAADKGSTRGIWQIGNIYEMGLLGEKDLSKAKELYVKAALLASPASLQSLQKMSSACVFSAIELEEILDEISSYLHITSIGNAFDLGKQQLYGELGRNSFRGLKMIEQVALNEHDKAINVLVNCYLYGISCNTNLKLVQYWYNQLKELYDVSAKSGNVFSLNKLGLLYLNGHIDTIDLEKAEFCFKDGIKHSSDPKWLYFLGSLYLSGRLGNKPISIGIDLVAQAIKIWQCRAALGDNSAYYDLGKAYYNINNKEIAIYWLSKAPNNIDAQILLAKIYLNNIGHEKHTSLGLKLLENIILEDDLSPSEAFEIVRLDINPHIIPWLQDKAANVIETISKDNCKVYNLQKYALQNLAKYEMNKLVGINYDLASKYYYHLFVNFKSVEAGNKLIHIYIKKNLPTEYYDTVKNRVLEISQLIKMDKIDLDNFEDCIYLLGKLYKIGEILPYNIQEASKWFHLLRYLCKNDGNTKRKLSLVESEIAELPSLDCNQNVQIVSDLLDFSKHSKINAPTIYKIMTAILGDIFYDTLLVDQNIDEAIFWYTESANTNNGFAAFKLAKIYQNDKKDIDASIKWLMLSTKLGHDDALKVLIQMDVGHDHVNLKSFLNNYQHCPEVQKSELRNIKPYKNLKLYPETTKEMLKLGKSLLRLGGEQNILNASYWFREAIEYNSIEAAVELYLMYKSGILGIHLVECSVRKYVDILVMIHSKLKKNKSEILTLLKYLSSTLEMSEMSSANALHKKIAMRIKKKKSRKNVIFESLRDIIFDLEMIIEELHCRDTISSALDSVLTQEISEELVT